MPALRHTAWVLGLSLAAQAAGAQSLGFEKVFEAAVGHDAQFEAARHERDVARHSIGVARAGLLPQLSWNASRTRTQGERDFSNALNQPVTTAVDYISPNNGLQLRAPLVNVEAVTRYRQALRQSDAADATFRVRGNELLDRVASAFAARLQAQAALNLAEAQLRTVNDQVARAEQRLARGEGSRIELSEAKVQRAAGQARVSEARDELRVARAALQRLTGEDPPELPQILPSWTLPATAPSELEEWQQLALRHNATVQAREGTVAVARLAVDRQQAGHWPRIDLVASQQTSGNESVTNLNQTNRLKSYGLQLSMPLFTGGGVSASVKAATSDLQRVQAELDAERRLVQLEVERQFLAAQNGRERLQLLREAVQAAEQTVEGVQRGVQAGLRTQTELLEAQSRLYGVQRDLLKVQVDALLARTRLQLISGSPPLEVAHEVDRWLAAGAQ